MVSRRIYRGEGKKFHTGSLRGAPDFRIGNFRFHFHGLFPGRQRWAAQKNPGKNSLDTAESPELWLLLEQPSARGFECRVWIRFSCGSYQNRSHLRVFRQKKKKKGRKKRHFVIAVEKNGGKDTISGVMYYLSICFLRAIGRKIYPCVKIFQLNIWHFFIDFYWIFSIFLSLF